MQARILGPWERRALIAMNLAIALVALAVPALWVGGLHAAPLTTVDEADGEGELERVSLNEHLRHARSVALALETRRHEATIAHIGALRRIATLIADVQLSAEVREMQTQEARRHATAQRNPPLKAPTVRRLLEGGPMPIDISPEERAAIHRAAASGLGPENAVIEAAILRAEIEEGG